MKKILLTLICTALVGCAATPGSGGWGFVQTYARTEVHIVNAGGTTFGTAILRSSSERPPKMCSERGAQVKETRSVSIESQPADPADARIGIALPRERFDGHYVIECTRPLPPLRR